jgi:hypothetical protein
MKVELQEIPGLTDAEQTEWKVRALVINGKNPVTTALAQWQKAHPKDHKAIMKVMRLAAQQHRVRNEKHVKASSNKKHGNNAYEMIAYTGIARLMFFYDEEAEAMIICTNEFEKGRGNDQDAAFARCAALRDVYLKYFHKKS